MHALLAGLMPPLSGVGSFAPLFAAGTLCGSSGHRGGFGEHARSIAVSPMKATQHTLPRPAAAPPVACMPPRPSRTFSPPHRFSLSGPSFPFCAPALPARPLLARAATGLWLVLVCALLWGCDCPAEEAPVPRRPLVVYLALDNDLSGECDAHARSEGRRGGKGRDVRGRARWPPGD